MTNNLANVNFVLFKKASEVYQKTEACLKTNGIARVDKYTLCEKIRKISIDIVQMAANIDILGNSCTERELRELVVNVMTLKTILKTLKFSKSITPGQHHAWSIAAETLYKEASEILKGISK